MVEPRARVFEYRVSTDPDWTAHSELGGTGIARESAWTPEHVGASLTAKPTYVWKVDGEEI